MNSAPLLPQGQSSILSRCTGIFKRKPKAEEAIFFFFSTLILGLHFYVYDKLPGDDVAFEQALDHQSLIEFLKHTYYSWSGRIAINAAAAVILDHTAVWRILNSLIFISLAYTIGRTTLRRENPFFSATIAISTLFAMPPFVFSEGVAWITGSLNYLWPAALGFFGILPLIYQDIKYSIAQRLVAISFSCFAAYSEQVALILVPFAIAWTLRLTLSRLATGWHFIHCILILANAFLLYAAPGQVNRVDAETRTWFPDFATLNLIDHLNIGVGLLLSHIYDKQNCLIQLCALLVFSLILNTRLAIYNKVPILIGCAVVILPAVLKLAESSSLFDSFYASPTITVENHLSTESYIRLAALLLPICLLFAGIAILATSKFQFRRLQIPALVIVASLTIVALGFSPTAYASGPRIFFTGDVAIAIVTCWLISDFGDRWGRNGIFIGLVSLPLAISLVRITNIYAIILR